MVFQDDELKNIRKQEDLASSTVKTDITALSAQILAQFQASLSSKVNLLHSFRVYFYLFFTRFECSFQSASQRSQFEQTLKTASGQIDGDLQKIVDSMLSTFK